MTKTRHGNVILALAALAGLANGAQAGDAPALVPDADGVLFAIGTEDKRRDEFKKSDWTGISQHACTVGIDCDVGTFPTRLVADYAARFYSDNTVQRAVVIFNLAEAQSNLMLVVARFGIETSVVRIDDKEPIIVTHEMMDPPSAEDVWGRFELPLGAVSAGMHQIEFSVLNEKAGTGRHSLDSITLLSVGADS